MSTVIRSHGRAFIILEIFVARLRFKNVTAQSRRNASIIGDEGGMGTAFSEMKY